MTYFFIYLVIGFTYTFGVMVHHNFTKKENDEIPELNDNSRFKVIKELFFSCMALTVGTLIWPIMLYFHIDRIINPPYKREEFSVKQSDLLDKFFVGEIENKEVINDPLNSVPPLPFGHLNSEWEEFKGKCLSTKEIWSFKAEYKDYSNTVIKVGYAAINEENVVLTYFICEDYFKDIELS